MGMDLLSGKGRDTSQNSFRESLTWVFDLSTGSTYQKLKNIMMPGPGIQDILSFWVASSVAQVKHPCLNPPCCSMSQHRPPNTVAF